MFGAIVEVRWRHVAVPFRSALTNSQTTYRMRESVLVEVTAQSGVTGIGEAALPAGSTFAAHGAGLDAFFANAAERMVGRSSVGGWRGLPFEIDAHEFGGWPAAAVCGVETALADLAAREMDVPLYHWLAMEMGVEPPPRAPAIECNGLIDLLDPGAAALSARALVAEGFRVLKLKVGGDVGLSLATLASVREAVGLAIEIRCDANRSWSNEDARTFLDGCAPYRVALCEEPLADPGHDFALLAALRRDTRAQLGLDESTRDLESLDRAIAARAAPVLVVKPMSSGLSMALAMLQRAHSAGLLQVVTTTFDLAPGTALAMHLAALARGTRLACGLATRDLVEHPLGTGVPDVHSGRIELGTAPGLGVTLDHAAIDVHAAGPWHERRA